MRLTADDAFAILEASPTALICASRSGEILFANATALELLDLTEAPAGNLDTHFLNWRALPFAALPCSERWPGLSLSRQLRLGFATIGW